MKINDEDTKKKIAQRLARIEGQLRGVQKMILEDRDCRDVLQQLIAIRSAVHAASLNFFQEVAGECLLDLDNQPNPENQKALMDDLIRMLSKVS